MGIRYNLLPYNKEKLFKRPSKLTLWWLERERRGFVVVANAFMYNEYKQAIQLLFTTRVIKPEINSQM